MMIPRKLATGRGAWHRARRVFRVRSLVLKNLSTHDQPLQEHDDIVQCVRPCRNPEPLQKIQLTERHPGKCTEHERLEPQRLAEWSDVVKRREEQRAEYGGNDAGRDAADPEQAEAIGE